MIRPRRLVIAGTVWYVITCIQGPFQSLGVIQRVTHLNNWAIGHSHIAVLGFAGFIALGTMWHVIPYISRRRIWSLRLVNLQFGLVLAGLTGFFVVLTIAGLVQGEAWDNGTVVYRVMPHIMPYMIARAASGILIITSAFVGFYNLMMTLRQGEPFDPHPLMQGGRDSMKMTPAILIIGALLIFWASTFTMVFLPMATMDVKPSEIWRPMNELEKEGFHLLRDERLLLLSFAVCARERLAAGIGADHRGGRLRGAWSRPCPARSGPGRTCPRRRASIPTTGMWPISRTPGTRARSRSCRAGSSWATRTS